MSENKPAPPCPSCGSAMVRKWGAVGAFLGCTAWPKCNRTLDIGGPTDEHPITRTRRLALRWLGRYRASWSDDDRADAVGDSLVAAMTKGWADQPTAWRFVALRAMRVLRGWQVDRGSDGRLRRRPYRSRAGAKPIAGFAMQLHGEPASPSRWIEETATEDGPQETAVIADSLQRAGITDPCAAARILASRGWNNHAIEVRTGIPAAYLRKYRAGTPPKDPRAAARLVELAATGRDLAPKRSVWVQPTIGDVYAPLAVVDALFGPKGWIMAAARRSEKPVSEMARDAFTALQGLGGSVTWWRLRRAVGQPPTEVLTDALGELLSRGLITTRTAATNGQGMVVTVSDNRP